jgi:hypothetical protein
MRRHHYINADTENVMARLIFRFPPVRSSARAAKTPHAAAPLISLAWAVA